MVLNIGCTVKGCEKVAEIGIDGLGYCPDHAAEKVQEDQELETTPLKEED